MSSILLDKIQRSGLAVRGQPSPSRALRARAAPPTRVRARARCAWHECTCLPSSRSTRKSEGQNALLQDANNSSLSCPLSTLFLATSNVFMLENQDSAYFLLALPSNLNGSQHTTSVEAWKLNSSNGIVVYSWPSWSSSLTTINIQHSFMAAQ